jgi:hypothetical protein
MYKYSGIFMIVIGAIHMVVSLVELVLHWGGFVAAGIFNAGPAQLANAMLIWLISTGMVIIMAGVVTDRFIKATGKPVPRSAGIVLAVLTAFLLVTEPVSGVWLLLFEVIVLLVQPGYKKALRG